MLSRSLACLLFLACMFAGCEFHFGISQRSGPVDDDYVAEPLSDSVKRYEHALEVCNEFVHRLKQGEYASIEAELCADSLRKATEQGGLEAFDKDVVAHFGALKSYKPQQWGFATALEEGRRLLYSTKIVEYERGKVRFTFTFDDDGKYEKLIGFHYRTWRGPAQPGRF